MRSHKSSTSITIAAVLIIGLVIGAAIGYLAAPGKEKTTTVTTTVSGGGGATTVTQTITHTVTQTAAGGGTSIPKEIPIGVLVTLTGALADAGPRYKVAASLAEEDINKFFESAGLPYRVKLYFEDTKTTPEGALAAVQSLAARGVKVIMAYTSGDCRTISSFINQHKIVAISYASTAPSLAIPGDYCFRLVPTDLHQAMALARLVWDTGTRKAVVVYRGDDWGVGLYNAFKKRFEQLGGTVQGVKYDPAAPDLSPEARKAESIVQQWGAGDDVGLVALSFNEDFISFLNAAKDSKILMSIKWYGSDGTVRSQRIMQEYGAFIAKSKIGFPNTYYTVKQLPKQASFAKRYKAQTGENPASYQFALYDGIWLATLSTFIAGKYDGEAIAKVLPTVADMYYGLSGWTKLDEAGDRAFSVYAVWVVNATMWYPIAYYDESTDSITWTPEGQAWLKEHGWTVTTGG